MTKFFKLTRDSESPKSPWLIALPALIVGPVTYLVTVALLFYRARAKVAA